MTRIESRSTLFLAAALLVVGQVACLREEPPAEDFVDSIDANSEPGSAEDKLLYRKIEGPWYLYYASSN